MKKKGVKKVLTFLMITSFAMSCKKVTKRKVAKDWQISSLYSEFKTLDSDGELERVLKIEGDEVHLKEADDYSGVMNYTGVPLDVSFSIKKDGTWEKKMHYRVTGKYVNTGGEEVVSEETVHEHYKGSWNFLGGVDTFKKNERIVFNVTSGNRSYAYRFVTANHPDHEEEYSYEDAYIDGEASTIYLVKDVSNKTLKLTYTGNSSTVGQANGVPVLKTGSLEEIITLKN
ncbi:MAG: hypothetical protein N4A35_08040 [Flavobacteriales bacterium]|jgi:hypothetical protein|nr:hypothetical protein [Flavobacteriales bacterium]